jgi:hypothetical protein
VFRDVKHVFDNVLKMDLELKKQEFKRVLSQNKRAMMALDLSSTQTRGQLK